MRGAGWQGEKGRLLPGEGSSKKKRGALAEGGESEDAAPCCKAAHPFVPVCLLFGGPTAVVWRRGGVGGVRYRCARGGLQEKKKKRKK